MWVASHNAKGYDPLYTNTNTRGYCVGNTERTTDASYNLVDCGNLVAYDDTLYFPRQASVDTCCGYWLASPSSSSFGGCPLSVHIDGVVLGIYYGDYGMGVRPLVSLKSGITATKVDNIWRF